VISNKTSETFSSLLVNIFPTRFQQSVFEKIRNNKLTKNLLRNNALGHYYLNKIEYSGMLKQFPHLEQVLALVLLFLPCKHLQLGQAVDAVEQEHCHS